MNSDVQKELLTTNNSYVGKHLDNWLIESKECEKTLKPIPSNNCDV